MYVQIFDLVGVDLGFLNLSQLDRFKLSTSPGSNPQYRLVATKGSTSKEFQISAGSYNLLTDRVFRGML